MRKRHNITFLPHRKAVLAKTGEDLLSLSRRAGIRLESICAGRGTCGKCKIKLGSGKLAALTQEELSHLSKAEINSGVRLACQAKPLSDAEIELVGVVPTLRIVECGHAMEAPLEPAVRKVHAALSSPSLSDNLADVERIEREIGIPFYRPASLSVLRALPNVLRDSGFNITAVVSGGRIVGIEKGNTEKKCYGVAVDIGTTTVVAALIDLATGKKVGVTSTVNSQRGYGADVLSRISFAHDLGGLVELNKAILRDVNGLIDFLSTEHETYREDIYEVVVVGNSTMLHLFAGISPTFIGSSPYVSVFRDGLYIEAVEAGVEINEFGRLFLLPAISSYVGADIVAGIVAADLHKVSDSTLFIDVGTNGEIVLARDKELVACSCAAGPALEGMNISCGTVAVEGAIEEVSINGSVRVKTIGQRPPVGLCGSGVIDVVAELLRGRILDPSGRLKTKDEYLKDGGSPRLARQLSKNGEAKFLLVDDVASPIKKEIYVSQKDIRQVQLAKGAIHSGISTLLNETGSRAGDISKVYIAGAFGQHLRLESLLRLGLIPSELKDKVEYIGNSAIAGGELALLSQSKRAEACGFSQKIKYFELSSYPDYQKVFVESLAFP